MLMVPFNTVYHHEAVVKNLTFIQNISIPDNHYIEMVRRLWTHAGWLIIPQYCT